MTQITVTFTLDDGADKSLLKRILNGLKGVLCNNVTIHDETNTHPADKTDEWIKKMRNLSNSVDSSLIDKDDERTHFILSK